MRGGEGKDCFNTLSSLIIGKQTSITAAQTAGFTVIRERKKLIKRTIDLSVVKFYGDKAVLRLNLSPAEIGENTG